MAELGWEPSIDAAHIGVAARAGVVTLTGHVQSFPQKVAAERTAARVKGMQFGCTDPFDRGDRLAGGSFGRHETADDRRAVDKHCAGAAYPGPADNFRPGQTQFIS